jgi:hypothetical protein
MARRGILVVVFGMVLGAAPVAAYDGQSIQFGRGSDQEIVVGTDFGMLRSRDGGATWRWFCAQAVRYAGQFAPRYAVSSTGAVFATTFDGAAVMRDGCSFDATPVGTTFVASLAISPSGAVHLASSSGGVPGDVKIYTSTDDGVTFPTTADPGMAADWWESIVVAPSNAQRVYLSGYRFNGQQKEHLLFWSDDGAASFLSLATTAFVTSVNSKIDIVGVDPTDANRVYATVDYTNGNSGVDLYRSDDAGTSWTKILTMDSKMAFVARANGEIVAATKLEVAKVSKDRGATWAPIGCALHISCLAENAAGELWACTHNYSDGTPSDGFGLMKTIDLVVWTGVLSFEDVAGPASCPSGTIETDTCEGQWPALQSNLLLATVTPDQCKLVDAPPSDGTPDGLHMPPDGGCCSGGSGPTSVVLALLVLTFWRASSRRRSLRRRGL